MRTTYKKTLLHTCLLAALLPAAGWAVTTQHATPQPTQLKAKTASNDVIAYILLNSPSDVVALKKIITDYQGKVPFTQLNVSFLSPTMDPAHITKDIGNLDLLLNDAFFSVDKKASFAPAASGQGAMLKSIITQLKAQGVDTYFSVGGWGYSSGGSDDNVTTFPLTTDTVTNLKSYNAQVTAEDFSAHNHDGGVVGTHNSLDQESTQHLTDTWVKVAQAFGADGIDLDYEEQWFPAQAHHFIKDSLPGHSWSFRNNFSTIKYATYLHALEQSTQAAQPKLGVSIAAPAVGAFNVNAVVGGDIYAGNFFYPANTTAPLKGVLYNMQHYSDASVGLANLKNIFVNTEGKTLLNGLTSMGVMSYDLDDGATSLQSLWCLGWHTNAAGESYPIARDPSGDGGYNNVSCSVYDQNLAIQNSMNQLGLSTKVNMGIEAYYPNYPIAPEAPSASEQYRWKDPFVVFDIPLQKVPSLKTTLPFSLAGGSGVSQNPTRTDYQHFWLTPKDLALDFAQQGNGTIFWSLNNNEASILKADQDGTTQDFGLYKNGIPALQAFLTDVASWQDIMQDIDAAYGNKTPAKATEAKPDAS